MPSPSDHEAATEDNAERFCQDFRQILKDRDISYREASRLSHWGKSTIAKAAAGPGLPQEKLVTDVLSAIGLKEEEVQHWRLRRQAVLDNHAHAADSGGPAAESHVSQGPRSRFPVMRLLIVATLLVATGIAVLIWMKTPSNEQVSIPAPNRTVLIQNMVAIGPDQLVEDDTPSYLSSKPVSRCASRGCKLAGTDMVSGDTLVVFCRLQGEVLTNADISSPGIKDNPNATASPMWYQGVWRDGRRGYISEVYLAPAARGGLDLPSC